MLHAASASAGAQPRACVDTRDVSWAPARPTAGALFELRIVARGVDGLHASIADTPLAVKRTRGDTVRMFAAVPIDSSTGATLRIECTGAEARTLRVYADSGRYRLERLRVAPAFSAPPDSALAARLASESERAAAVSRGALGTPVLWKTAFVAPRPSRITSGFGNGRTFNGEVLSRHMGTDYAGAVGAPVRATNRGVVRLTGRFFLGGNVVYVDHGGGVSTAYLHLSRILVAEGDTVEQGGRIGLVGATGRVTGPHLHFIARVGGTTVNPLSLIGKQ